MITLRRNAERRQDQGGEHDIRLTFTPPESPGPPTSDFGILTSLREIRLPPGGGAASHPPERAEIVTYVYKGTLAQVDSTGRSGVVLAGEYQCMTLGRGIRHRDTNASQTDWAHCFRISLRLAAVGLGSAHEQKRFTATERRNTILVVASGDGRMGSLRLQQDVLIHSSVIDPGHHLVHELLPGRTAWLHIVDGEATLDDIVLIQGDGVGVTKEPSVSLTACVPTEVLLIDLGPSLSSFAAQAAH